MASNSLYLQCFAGVSGDMFLATLLGLGVPETHLRQELTKLGIDDEFVLQVSNSEKQGISGLRVDVVVKAQTTAETKSEASDAQNPEHHHDHSHSIGQRDYKAIKVLINQSALDDAAKQRALTIFEEVARAEAHIHNQAIDTVHFHEVGATDSIVDIVGAAIGLEYLVKALNLTQICCSTVELGSGFVRCAHGDYPVPAPATAQILQGVPVSLGKVQGEATTPTGAAILKATVKKFTDSLTGQIQQTVYGIGHRETNVPNVLRAQIVSSEVVSLQQKIENDVFAKIEANIDDMSPEAYASLYESLFDAGASDVYLQSIVMKKSRPAQMLSVLCRADNAERLGEVVLNNSTTIGLRILPFTKMILPREILEVPTTLGGISVKLVRQPNGARRWKSEYDDIHRIAQQLGQPYLTVKNQIDMEVHRYLSEQGYLISISSEDKAETNHG